MKNYVADPEGFTKYLNASATSLFVITAIGQWIFVLFIVALYVVATLIGDFERWNVKLPHGYEVGNSFGNLYLGIHLIFAAVISFIGPLQLIPAIRNRWPLAHRWSGRIYVISAVLMSISGLYLVGSGRKVIGDFSQHLAITINGLLILGCTLCALYYALKRKYAIHRRWALRMFWAVSGVWLFRIGLMFWLVINGKPVGFDVETFSGPFLTLLAVTVFILPVLIVEAYLRTKDGKNSTAQLVVGTGMFLLVFVMAIGIFGATMSMWLPHVLSGAS